MPISSRRSRALLGVGGFGLLSVIWGTQFLVIKQGLHGMPALLAAALRFAVLAAGAHIAVLVTRSKAPADTKIGRMAFGVAQALSFGALYWAQTRIPSALAGVLTSTTPFFVAVLAHRFVPGERLALRTVLPLTCGFAGVSLIVAGTRRFGGALEVTAVIAILGGEVAGALNKVIGKRLIAHVPAPILLRDMGVVVALLNLFGWILFEHHQGVAFAPENIAAFLYLGLIASFAASGVYMLMLREFAVTNLAYIQFTSAVVAAVTGVLLGGESLTWPTCIGMAGTLLGLALLAGGLRMRRGPDA